MMMEKLSSLPEESLYRGKPCADSGYCKILLVFFFQRVLIRVFFFFSFSFYLWAIVRGICMLSCSVTCDVNCKLIFLNLFYFVG